MSFKTSQGWRTCTLTTVDAEKGTLPVTWSKWISHDGGDSVEWVTAPTSRQESLEGVFFIVFFITARQRLRIWFSRGTILGPLHRHGGIAGVMTKLVPSEGPERYQRTSSH